MALLTVLSAAPTSADHQAWRVPSLIESDNRGDAGSPDVAVDSAGRAIAVWDQFDGTRYSIWANRFVPEVGWGSPALLETDDFGDNRFAQVAMDGQGNAVVVWNHIVYFYSDGIQFSFSDAIYANHFVVGRGWGTATPVVVKASGEGQAGVRDIAMDERGNAIAMWVDGGGCETSRVWASRFVPGMGWDSGTSLGIGCSTRLAVGADGAAIAIWGGREATGTRTGLWANRLVVGVGWGVPSLIEANASVYSIAMASDGSAVVVYHLSNVTRYSAAMATSYVPAVGWSVATPVSEEHTSKLQVLIDGPGSAVAVWFGWKTSDYETSRELLVNRYRAGLGWGAETSILQGFGDSWVTADLALGTDPKGNLLVVFNTDGNQNWPLGVYAIRYAHDVGWGVPAPIGTGHPSWNSSPALAVDPHGNAIAVWPIYDGTRSNIWTNRYVSTELTDMRAALDLANATLAAMQRTIAILLVLQLASVVSCAVLFLMYRTLPRGKGNPHAESHPEVAPVAATRTVVQGPANDLASRITVAAPAAPPEKPRWIAGPTPAGPRLTAKERILLYLSRYIRYAEAVEVPAEMTQDEIAGATWIDPRHIAQYVRPLVRDGLVRERTAHVRDGRQRRRVYDLTDAGRRVAQRIVNRTKGEIVPVWDGEHVWEIRVSEILEKLNGKTTVLDVARHLMEAGVVDFAALGANQETASSHTGESDDERRELT